MFGGVLAPNGKIYGIPHTSDSVLIIDPETNTSDTTTITGLTGRWAGGVLAPNGKIYGIPYGFGSVLIIDPETNTIDNTSRYNWINRQCMARRSFSTEWKDIRNTIY